MASSKKGPLFAFCTVCNSDINIAGGGVYDVKRHCDGVKHKKSLQSVSAQPSISSLMNSASKESLSSKVLKSEVFFAKFVAEHNLSFSTADHFTKLCKKMFPDSNIAEKFSCARTKTTALVTHALAHSAEEDVVAACRTQAFTILSDGGNDNFMKKYFAILVRLWDDKRREAVVQFLDMPVCNVATGETLFQAMNTALEERSIPWTNAIGFASDSASVMVGKRNSVLSRVRERNPDVFSLGCMCHLTALCAAAALKKLPISIDNLLIEVYYHFKHSSKRCEEFRQVLEDFDGIAPVSVLKHCTTRWLSLERAVKRLIDLWQALHAYFDREKGTGDRPRRVADALASIEVKLTCHFVAFALKPLNTFNTALQTSASRIGTMQADMRSLLRTYLANFVEPGCLADINTDNIEVFDYRDESQHASNDELAIGTSTRLLLEEYSDDVEGTTTERKFFTAVRSFYQEVVAKMLSKFPFRDLTIRDLAILNPASRSTISTASALRLSKRFTSLTSPNDIDDLECEVRDYKSMAASQLPSVSSGPSSIDHFWADLADMRKITDTEEKRFTHLPALCKRLLVLIRLLIRSESSVWSRRLRRITEEACCLLQ